MPQTLTELYQLRKYDTGDNPGADNLNFNLDTVDSALIPDGSSFPATFPVNGRFVKTNDGLYKNTGTHDAPVWTKILGTPIGVILADGSVAFTGNQSMGGNKLTGLGDPSAGTDADNKQSRDAAIATSASSTLSAAEAADPTADGTTIQESLNVLSVKDSGVSNAKLANMADQTIKGNNAG